jgi:catalase
MVEAVLGMEGAVASIIPARPPIDLAPSPSLSLIKKAPATLRGRKIAVVVTDGVDDGVIGPG